MYAEKQYSSRRERESEEKDEHTKKGKGQKTNEPDSSLLFCSEEQSGWLSHCNYHHHHYCHHIAHASFPRTHMRDSKSPSLPWTRVVCPLASLLLFHQFTSKGGLIEKNFLLMDVRKKASRAVVSSIVSFSIITHHLTSSSGSDRDRQTESERTARSNNSDQLVFIHRWWWWWWWSRPASFRAIHNVPEKIIPRLAEGSDCFLRVIKHPMMWRRMNDQSACISLESIFITRFVFLLNENELKIEFFGIIQRWRTLHQVRWKNQWKR